MKFLIPITLIFIAGCQPGFFIRRAAWLDTKDGPVFAVSCDRWDDCAKLATQACSASGLTGTYKVVGKDEYGWYSHDEQIECGVVK